MARIWKMEVSNPGGYPQFWFTMKPSMQLGPWGIQRVGTQAKEWKDRGSGREHRNGLSEPGFPLYLVRPKLDTLR